MHMQRSNICRGRDPVRQAQPQLLHASTTTAASGKHDRAFPNEKNRKPALSQTKPRVFCEHNLDYIMVATATHAPGQSAFNAVERRMAPLSKELAGVILPYDVYGSHLDSSNKTVDKELELKNFAAAGQSLTEIWSSMVFDYLYNFNV